MPLESLFPYIVPQHPSSRYALIVCLIVIMLILLKYFARFLQWLTENFMARKNLLKQSWLKPIAESRVLINAFYALGAAAVASLAQIMLSGYYPLMTSMILRVLDCIVIVSGVFVISSALNVIVARHGRSSKLPLKSLVQALKVIVWTIALVLTISALFDKKPLYFLGGLTALSAIILLVFKDSILGLVSSFQLALNDLVRVGDWIEIPSQGADGEVEDILLSTVRVRNWDNTIVSIPAYDLISRSFTNWRGMSESGARRIKRAINIDIKTVRFLSEDDIKKYEKIPLLKKYLENKVNELSEANENSPYRRRLSNLGTFRAYCFEYLKKNPNITQDFTCMVRQLAPTSEGLPLEIYAFANTTVWTDYEAIQADIFDHLFSVISAFDLKVFQRYGI